MATPSPEAVRDMLHEACRVALGREDAFEVFDVMQMAVIIADSVLDSEKARVETEPGPDWLEGMYHLATGDEIDTEV